MQIAAANALSDVYAMGGPPTICSESPLRQFLPVLPYALEMARKGMVPGGALQNHEYIKSYLMVVSGVKGVFVEIAANPQASGGICAALLEKDADHFLKELKKCKIPAFKVVW